MSVNKKIGGIEKFCGAGFPGVSLGGGERSEGVAAGGVSEARVVSALPSQQQPVRIQVTAVVKRRGGVSENHRNPGWKPLHTVAKRPFVTLLN